MSQQLPDYAQLPIRRPRVICERRLDGSILISQDYALPPAWPSIPHLLATRAAERPDRWLIARRERHTDGSTGAWQGHSYADVLRQARAVARWLIEHGYGPGKTIAVISGPSAEHLVIMYAAQIARALYVPVSVNFSLGQGPFDRLNHVLDTCSPQLVFAEDGHAVAPAIAAIADRVEHVVVASGVGLGQVSFAELVAKDGGDEVDRSITQITVE